jgi:hypothetical protein
MHDALTSYFAGEKLGGLVAAALGLFALVAAAGLVRGSYRGAALPLGLVALLQLGVGGVIYFRTDAQVKSLRAELHRSPAAYKSIEAPRMAKVMRSFVMLETIEVILIAAGCALCLLYKHREGLLAAGMGLLFQASIMLIFDLVAEQRGQKYVQAIARYIP